MGISPIWKLAVEYPQLQLPVKKGMSASVLYKDVVKSGGGEVVRDTGKLFRSIDMADSWCGFIFSKKDYIQEYSYKCGNIRVIYISNRDNFNLFIQKLIHKCEPVEIPASMGAAMISGILNWNKIYSHKKLYMSDGNSDWDNEFRRFTNIKANYLDSLIVLSEGEYSDVDYSKTIYDYKTWLKLSLEIRKYHELTHFICRTKYIYKKNILFDEIFADCMGLICATESYDIRLAKELLGINIDSDKQGGRIYNYRFDEDINIVIDKARILIEKIGNNIKETFIKADNLEDMIDKVYKETYI